VESAGVSSVGLGVVIALVGAVFMAVGAHFQSAGLGTVADTMPRPSLFQLARSRSWLAGSLVLGVAIVLQLTAVTLAPVALVQPTGIIALVVSVAIRHGQDQRRPQLRTIIEVGVCVAAVVVFVLVAGQYTEPSHIDGNTALTLCAGFTLTLVAVVILNRFCGERYPLAPVAGAGILFGFVITLMKVVLTGVARVLDSGWQASVSDLPFLLCALSTVFGFYAATRLLQTAHRLARADAVLAGLTVIDPLVAAFLGILLLGELAAAPIWVLAVLVAPAAIAIRGVIVIARISGRSIRRPGRHGI
jgi:hypothetical protein